MIPTALKARRAGANYSLRILIETKRAGIPASLGFALVEQESGFANVFGHDPTIFVGKGEVTKAKYLAYKKQRGLLGRGGMQGVGPCQLTYYAFQDEADRIGGCWKPACNIRVAITHLAHLIQMYGRHDGVRAYNGAGPAAEAYADSVLKRQHRWHNILA